MHLKIKFPEISKQEDFCFGRVEGSIRERFPSSVYPACTPLFAFIYARDKTVIHIFMHPSKQPFSKNSALINSETWAHFAAGVIKLGLCGSFN